ncbi:hypothetical protein D3C75_799780 [compost metagenome]
MQPLTHGLGAHQHRVSPSQLAKRDIDQSGTEATTGIIRQHSENGFFLLHA